jgi:hypothetical protein
MVADGKNEIEHDSSSKTTTGDDFRHNARALANEMLRGSAETGSFGGERTPMTAGPGSAAQCGVAVWTTAWKW